MTSRTDLSRLPDWPRLMTRQQAAAYCQMSADQFVAACPVRPLQILPSTSPQARRWDRHEIDRWLDSFQAGGKAGLTREQWLAKLDAGDDETEVRPAH